MKPRVYKTLLLSVGVAHILMGLIHLLIIPWGVAPFEFLGAPASVINLVSHQQYLQLLLALIPIAVLFVFAGLLALSAAGIVKPFPQLPLSLIVIGCIELMRGAVLFLWPFPDLIQSIQLAHPQLIGMTRPLQAQDWLISAICFFSGLIYLCNGLILKKNHYRSMT